MRYKGTLALTVGDVTKVPLLPTTMDADREAMSDELEKPQEKSQLRQRLDADIDEKWADMILFGCFFCSGLVDSMAYNMYQSFVSMQTGQ